MEYQGVRRYSGIWCLPMQIVVMWKISEICRVFIVVAVLFVDFFNGKTTGIFWRASHWKLATRAAWLILIALLFFFVTSLLYTSQHFWSLGGWNQSRSLVHCPKSQGKILTLVSLSQWGEFFLDGEFALGSEQSWHLGCMQN